MSKSQASPAAFSSLSSCQGLASSGQLSHTSPTPSPSVSTWWALGVKGQLSISLRIPGQREAEINLTFSVGLSLSLLYLFSVCLSQSAFPFSTHSHPITCFQSHPLSFSHSYPPHSRVFSFPSPPFSPSLPFSPFLPPPFPSLPHEKQTNTVPSSSISSSQSSPTKSPSVSFCSGLGT